MRWRICRKRLPVKCAPLGASGPGCVSISGAYEDEDEPKVGAYPASVSRNFLFPGKAGLGEANKVAMA